MISSVDKVAVALRVGASDKSVSVAVAISNNLLSPDSSSSWFDGLVQRSTEPLELEHVA